MVDEQFAIADAAKPECVVIDTSIWRSSLLLKNPVGESLIYTLGRQGGLIGLPEVIEMELPHVIAEAGLEASSKLEASYRIVSALHRQPFEPSLPTQGDLEAATRERIESLERLLVRIPFTHEHSRAALDMVVKKLPPNGPSNQQFKDSAIWQAALEIADRYNVHFVTGDCGFWENRDPSKGLAGNLLQDCERMRVTVRAYPSISSCLSEVEGAEPDIDRDLLTDLILNAIFPELISQATRHRFFLRELLERELKIYRTSDAARLAVDYQVTVRFEEAAETTTSPGRENPRVVAGGTCYFFPDRPRIEDNYLNYVKFWWDYAYGGQGFYVRAMGGDPTIPYSRTVNM
jgi:hypothetical protein